MNLDKEKIDQVGYCCPFQSHNGVGGCHDSCEVMFCECVSYSNLMEWLDESYQNSQNEQRPTNHYCNYILGSSQGLSPYLNVGLYCSFYKRINMKPTCCGAVGILCCPICSYVQMKRYHFFYKQKPIPFETISKNPNTTNSMNADMDTYPFLTKV